MRNTGKADASHHPWLLERDEGVPIGVTKPNLIRGVALACTRAGCIATWPSQYGTHFRRPGRDLRLLSHALELDLRITTAKWSKQSTKRRGLTILWNQKCSLVGLSKAVDTLWVGGLERSGARAGEDVDEL